MRILVRSEPVLGPCYRDARNVVDPFANEDLVHIACSGEGLSLSGLVQASELLLDGWDVRRPGSLLVDARVVLRQPSGVRWARIEGGPSDSP